MNTSYIYKILIITTLTTLTSCKEIGHADFGEISISGRNSSGADGSNDTEKDEGVSFDFQGATSVDQISDSLARVNWTSNSDAVAYSIHSVGGEEEVLIGLSWGQDNSSYAFTDLTPDTDFSIVVRMINNKGITGNNSNAVDFKTNRAPQAPSSLTLTSPLVTPDSETRPTFTITGEKEGDIITLYSDSCSTSVGEGALGADLSVEIRVEESLEAQAYTLFADAKNDLGYKSECSSSGVSYTVESCPSGYALVPEDSSLGVDKFCIMQHEAKAQAMNAGVAGDIEASGGSSSDWATIYHETDAPSGYRPISSSQGNPWSYINQSDASSACQNLGEGYDLISNSEWMSVARNAEAQSSNWSGGAVANGCLFTGNTGDDDACGYNEGGVASGDSRNAKSRLTLSNGSQIWDLSGNVWEWVDWTLGGSLSSTPPTDCDTSGGYEELPDLSCGSFSQDDYMPLNPSGVSPELYNSVYGLGRFRGGSGAALVRGGYYYGSGQVGLFSLSLSSGPEVSYASIGFRCVYRL